MDMTKPVGAFCDYVNVPNKMIIVLPIVQACLVSYSAKNIPTMLMSKQQKSMQLSNIT
jgi:hypothetical protein